MSAESGVLSIQLQGHFSLAEARQTFLEMLEGVAHHQIGKVLVDGRTLQGEPSVIERFYLGEFAAHAVMECVLGGRCVAPKFAYVLNEPMLDPGRLAECVAANRGMQVKAFDDLDLARAWLELRLAA